MKKVNILLFAAALVIGLVMLRLVFSGVELRERKMVKWSSVASASEAGRKIARFMYPILNERQVVSIATNSDFSKNFFEAFAARSVRDKVKAQVIPLSKDEPGEFQVRIQSLEKEKLEASCQLKDKVGCLGLKALNQFEKKERDKNKVWINMYQLNEDSAVLFYWSDR